MARTLDEAELLKLVDALADGRLCSGEVLAARAGITRAALAKRMDHLRDWGLDLIAEAGRGYRLAAPLERLETERIRDALPASASKLLRRLDVLPRTDSTNQRLLEADPAQDPQALFAELQTAGRGRRGRAWRSPFGANLYFSLAWTFQSWPPQLTALPLAVGVACALALRKLGIDMALLRPEVAQRPAGGGQQARRHPGRAAWRGGWFLPKRRDRRGPQRGDDAGTRRVRWISPGPRCRRSWVQPRRRAGPWPRRCSQRCWRCWSASKPRASRHFAAGWAALDATANQPLRIEGAGAPLEGIGRTQVGTPTAPSSSRPGAGATTCTPAKSACA